MKSRIVLLALGALIAVFAYWNIVPTPVIGRAQAEIVGAHREQTKYGAKPLRLSAKLDSGRIAGFTPPKDQAYHVGAPVVLEVRRQEWWPHYVSYRFVAAYANAAEE